MWQEHSLERQENTRRQVALKGTASACSYLAERSQQAQLNEKIFLMKMIGHSSIGIPP